MDSVTQWLELWHQGDADAIERVTVLVYDDLRRRAAHYMRGEGNVTSLQATALVHEAYLRMSSLQGVAWEGRSHFIAVVTTMMRRILVDHARARKASKRDAGGLQIDTAPEAEIRLDTLALDQALQRLATHHPRCARVAELRFFGDLDFPEIADILDLSLATIEREWRFARTYLRKAIEG